MRVRVAVRRVTKAKPNGDHKGDRARRSGVASCESCLLHRAWRVSFNASHCVGNTVLRLGGAHSRTSDLRKYNGNNMRFDTGTGRWRVVRYRRSLAQPLHLLAAFQRAYGEAASKRMQREQRA